jgi:hypothetical protein
MPLNAGGSFDNTGGPYQVANILDEKKNLDLAKYQAYSPLFLSTTFAIAYGLSFASITATVTHTIIYYRKQIWTQSRRSMHEQDDIHARLMARYPQVPDWWYAVIFCKPLFLSPTAAVETKHLRSGHVCLWYYCG